MNSIPDELPINLQEQIFLQDAKNSNGIHIQGSPKQVNLNIELYYDSGISINELNYCPIALLPRPKSKHCD